MHLAFAMFLAFLAWPASSRSPRDRVPLLDWVFALAGAFAGAYLLLFYAQLATRPGQPTLMDVVDGDGGHRAAAGSHAARRRLADGSAGCAVHRLCDGRSLHAGSAAAQGRIAEPADFAPVADHRRRVRHRAGRVDRRDLRLRAVRHLAGSRRRRQLHDAGELRGAGAPARRPGQGGRGVVRPQRHDLRLVGVQRGVRRHLHHPADEEVRLRRREGRRHRDHVFGQRPDHAAGDGRCRLPDGRVRGHPVLRHRQARAAAGRAVLHRPVLHRPPGGGEAGHESHRHP